MRNGTRDAAVSHVAVRGFASPRVAMGKEEQDEAGEEGSEVRHLSPDPRGDNTLAQ